MSNGSEFTALGSGTPSGDSHTTNTSPASGNIPKGWHKPLPEQLPKAGYWPAIMALGITFMLWGLAVGFNEVVSTIIILFFIGLILFILALIGWIGDLRDERKDQNE
ncbi:MAG: hypothetical protein E2O72_03780 [Candidatus Dadabacteria bacterium]|nr:MAG: hypothetical protein E2O72_03780 [Candidatus Dadabacteria bacterium]TDJ01015.1 MAG: hypothetical protein E2O70_04540 [Candidatus Dadabacteria bacterium]